METNNSPWTIKQRCSADWETMRGDDKRRFCWHCQKFVYNISAMSPVERDTFAAPANRHECVYYSEHASGSVVDLSLLARLRQRFPFLRLIRWSALVAVLPLIVTGCPGMRCPPNVKVVPLPPQAPPVQPVATNQTTNAVSP